MYLIVYYIIFDKILPSLLLLVSFSQPLRQRYSETITHCLVTPTSVVFDVDVVGNNKDSGVSHKKYTWMLNIRIHYLPVCAVPI